MADLNIVTLMGRLTADPETKSTPSGVTLATFTLANDTGWNENAKTNFIRCIAWRKTAEFAGAYLHKGQKIVVNGTLTQRTYTDKNNQRREAVEVVVDNVYFADYKRPETTYEEYTEVKDDPQLPFQDEDLPF